MKLNTMDSKSFLSNQATLPQPLLSSSRVVALPARRQGAGALLAVGTCDRALPRPERLGLGRPGRLSAIRILPVGPGLGMTVRRRGWSCWGEPQGPW